MTDQYADLVLEGGGVKGIGLLGAASLIESKGYTFRRCAGTSAGAIGSSLIAAGMPDAERQETMRSIDYSKFQDGTLLDRAGWVGKGLEVILHQGIYRGDYFHKWISDQLARCNVHTFRDLPYEDDGLAPERRYRLVVVVSDVSRGRMVRLPWDYHEYGLDPAEQPVADAVRASMSVPFFFRPVELKAVDS